MISSAKANFQRISPRKAGGDQYGPWPRRGRSSAASGVYSEGSSAHHRLLASAVANAKQKAPSAGSFYISKATVDQGPNSHLRRWRPRAMGRATPIVKGVSHITIELDQR